MSKNLERISVVAGLTAVSRVLGLGRDMFMAAVFGTTALNSAFVTAFALPNLFRRFLGEGSLTAALVPTLNRELEREGKPGVFALLSKVVCWLGLASLGVVLAAMLLFSNAERIPGLEPRWYLAAQLAVVLFPYLVFVCLAAAFSATLNLLGRFTEPALSPIWLNLCMIGFLGGAGLWVSDEPTVRMTWLCAGVLAGGFLQMAVPAAVLIRMGWRPAWRLDLSGPIRALALLMAPGLFGAAIYQINVLISRLLAFSLNEPAASLLNLANRIMELPVGIFTIAVATVVFPVLTRSAGRGDWEGLRDTYRQGLRLILAVNIPAAVGLLLLREPIVRVLFERGAFTPADTAAMGPVLIFFSLGLPFLSVVSLQTRAFYALEDMATPVRVAGWSLLINLGLSLLLMRWFSTPGLAAASNLTLVAQCWMLQRRLCRRRPELRFRDCVRAMLQCLAAAAVMAVCVILVGWAAGSAGSSTVRDWVELAAGIPAGIAIYGVVLWLAKFEDRFALVNVLLRRNRSD